MFLRSQKASQSLKRPKEVDKKKYEANSHSKGSSDPMKPVSFYQNSFLSEALMMSLSFHGMHKASTSFEYIMSSEIGLK